MKQSNEINLLAKALVAMQSEVKAVVKDASNPHYKSWYASLDAITEYARPLLAKHGFAVLQGGGDLTNGGIMVETTLLHHSGQWISSSFELPVEKPTPQSAGSAITYGRRYGLAALLALTTDEDDDGNAASAPRQTTARPAPQLTNGQPPFRSFVMPFGKSKGVKQLKEMETDDLASALEWAAEKDKYNDFQVAARKELQWREGTVVEVAG